MSLVLLKNLVFRGKQSGKERYGGKYSRLCDDDLESASVSSSSDLCSFEDEDTSKEKIPAERSIKTLIPTPRISPRVISDATIGLSDGLTVPFALTAGLSTLGSTHIVIYGGLAELSAGAISMGLGGYLASRGEADAHAATLNSTKSLIRDSPSSTADLIHTTFDGLDLPSELLHSLSAHLATTSEEKQLDFLMRFHHSASSSPTPVSRAYISALTIAAGYFIGGFTPLLPYLLVPSQKVVLAFWCSVALMIVALFAFGAVKTVLVGGAESREVRRWVSGGAEMVVLGGVAAGAAMGFVRAFGGE
ncbi:DUF125-domain-containing protein [Viridothelium virens]|uniref:DUF125-domain-containing protein n=1 Tax=Viridothelium virens TaxID=1048519 RepID=A0A6A6GZE1_VIRVR|nr:DUF125-domain-containing protein [Viridothelium virens]